MTIRRNQDFPRCLINIDYVSWAPTIPDPLYKKGYNSRKEKNVTYSYNEAEYIKQTVGISQHKILIISLTQNNIRNLKDMSLDGIKNDILIDGFLNYVNIYFLAKIIPNEWNGNPITTHYSYYLKLLSRDFFGKNTTKDKFLKKFVNQILEE